MLESITHNEILDEIMPERTWWILIWYIKLNEEKTDVFSSGILGSPSCEHSLSSYVLKNPPRGSSWETSTSRRTFWMDSPCPIVPCKSVAVDGCEVFVCHTGWQRGRRRWVLQKRERRRNRGESARWSSRLNYTMHLQSKWISVTEAGSDAEGLIRGCQDTKGQCVIFRRRPQERRKVGAGCQQLLFQHLSEINTKCCSV